MKELDILLERFVTDHEEALAKGEWPNFEELLKLEDDLLWNCMRDPDQPELAVFSELAAAIRQAKNAGA